MQVRMMAQDPGEQEVQHCMWRALRGGQGRGQARFAGPVVAAVAVAVAVAAGEEPIGSGHQR